MSSADFETWLLSSGFHVVQDLPGYRVYQRGSATVAKLSDLQGNVLYYTLQVGKLTLATTNPQDIVWLLARLGLA